jgi:hypothetical protein
MLISAVADGEFCDMNMVERVARAIVFCGAARGSSDAADLAEVIEYSWRHHVDIARAAIEAMQEPTAEMIDAPWRSYPSVQTYEPVNCSERIWRAMAIAALYEKQIL